MSDELDPGYGQLMLFVFTAAVLFVTGTVAILCFIRSWGMLAVVFGIHLLATTGVSYMIALGLADRTHRRRKRTTADAAVPALPSTA